MKHAIVIAAICLATAVPFAANAKSMDGKKMMMTPTMEQCHGGYQKAYSKSMHWSKSKFKKACKKMMKSHPSKMKDGMMKKDGMKKDDMMKKDKM